MKDALASHLRHWLTAGLTALTLWAVTFFTLAPGDVDTFRAATAQLVEPLTLMLVVVLISAWRLFLSVAAAFFRRNSSGGSFGGMMLLIACGTAAAIGVLPSCSPGRSGLDAAMRIRGTK